MTDILVYIRTHRLHRILLFYQELFSIAYWKLLPILPTLSYIKGMCIQLTLWNLPLYNLPFIFKCKERIWLTVNAYNKFNMVVILSIINFRTALCFKKFGIFHILCIKVVVVIGVLVAQAMGCKLEDFYSCNYYLKPHMAAGLSASSHSLWKRRASSTYSMQSGYKEIDKSE